MNTLLELREPPRESPAENRGFRAGLDSIADIMTCQEDEEEDEDQDPEEGDEKEEEEDTEEGEVDQYYLG